jgi:hypothetical protein
LAEVRVKLRFDGDGKAKPLDSHLEALLLLVDARKVVEAANGLGSDSKRLIETVDCAFPVTTRKVLIALQVPELPRIKVKAFHAFVDNDRLSDERDFMHALVGLKRGKRLSDIVVCVSLQLFEDSIGRGELLQIAVEFLPREHLADEEGLARLKVLRAGECSHILDQSVDLLDALRRLKIVRHDSFKTDALLRTVNVSGVWPRSVAKTGRRALHPVNFRIHQCIPRVG